MQTPCEKFAAATLLLAGNGNIKDRLLNAFQNELADVDVNAIPLELRAAYDDLQQALHRERPLRGENAVRATLRKISGAEADQLAQSVVRLCIDLTRSQMANNVARQVEARAPAAIANSAAVVQLFPG
jgi:hypothetical protein